MRSSKHKPTSYWWILRSCIVITMTAACGRTPLPSPEAAFREVSPPIIADDLDFAGMEEAITAQRSALLSAPQKEMHFGTVTIVRQRYVEALDRLIEILQSNASRDDKSEYIKKNFRFLELYGGKSWGEVLLTGYFEPVLKGSLEPTTTHTQPLYARPDDLVTVELNSFSSRFSEEGALKARIDGKKVIPYYSREEIDGEKKALAGRGLELCWVDPIDAFFLQIQGSGTIQLSDGNEIHLTYAEKNGLKYEPIGKYLRKEIAPHKITMQRIESVLRAMPLHERFKVMFMNLSYVFFQRSTKRAVTAMGAPATSGRTIASDPRYIPKGSLAFVTFSKPIFTTGPTSDLEPPIKRVSRFVLDQDTGGAIKGTDHIDLFWGRGEEGKRVAGLLQDQAHIMYLVPR